MLLILNILCFILIEGTAFAIYHSNIPVRMIEQYNKRKSEWLEIQNYTTYTPQKLSNLN